MNRISIVSLGVREIINFNFHVALEAAAFNYFALDFFYGS